jgi:MT0933-like antitoxin protein
MGVLDSIKGLFSKNSGQAKGGVDKAADVADDKTGGKYTEQIDKGADATTDQIDKLGDES